MERPMTGIDTTISGPDGSFGAYLAAPADHKGPGIVVIQEIFGVNAVVRGICDDFAAQGYFALAPDLFWRIEPNVRITDKTEAEWKRAFEFYKKFNADTGVKDIQAAIAHLRGVSGVTAKVGTVGNCLGGLLAYLCVTRTNTDVSVSYYGVGIETKLPERDKIKKPLMLHIAAKDQFVPPAAQKQILDALGKNPMVKAHMYPGVDHAFARPGGQHFDKAAAALANSRTAEFFRLHLQ
jgi:carboxymethylenebutenolidase